MLKQIQGFLRDDRGQATTEYILILAVVVMIAMKFKGTMSSRIEKIANALFGDIEEAVKVD